VNGDKVSRADFNKLLDQAKRSFKARKQPFPKAGSPEYNALQNQAMTYLVQRAEFDQQAKKLGVEINDKKVDDRLAQIKKQYFAGSDKKYQAQLKAQGLTEDQVKQDIRSQLLSQAIFDKVTSKVKVSDADVTKYYKTHKSLYGRPESRDVRHILVKKKPQADKLYAQLKAGGNFAALAKKFSQDPGSAAQGGKLTVSRGQTVPQFDKVAFKLKKNEISPPVKTQYGWHIIQALTDVKPASQTPLKDVKASIKQQLGQTKKNEAMTKWVNDLKKDYAKKVHYQVGYAPPSTGTGTGGTTTGK
jgi:parvulin-like peptidyl-prolyl isomerase